MTSTPASNDFDHLIEVDRWATFVITFSQTKNQFPL